MLINTFLDTEDFVHLYYPENESPPASQGCGAGARLHSKYPARLPSPDYDKIAGVRDMWRAPAPEPAPHRVRAADLYPRTRAHYDEPRADVPFKVICGEFVQWVGRISDGGTIAMSNYRVHVQPKRSGCGAAVPLRLLDAVETRELQLILLCKDGKTVKCTFTTNEECAEWWRRLTTALTPVHSLQDTFAAAYAAWAKEQPPASAHRALVKSAHQQAHWFAAELDRLGFTTKGAWRVTAVNSDYKLCPSYPPLLIVPACIGDEDLDSVARFRAMRRIPAVVWRHRGNGAVIARSSQPEVGWLGWRSSVDERLLAAFVTACSADTPSASTKQNKLLIVDARSYASAVTNRARGGGCECQQYYPAADIQFMCLPNIHHVRKSFQQLRTLVAEPAEQLNFNWHSNLERTLWLQYVSGVGRAGALVARAVLAARPVLVHCSDGWDRTPQLVATAQLLLDPYYRSVQGFRVLIEREWLDFGHKFADRCGHSFGTEEPNERSPIFLQWLDLVHQCMIQYPCSFEFSQAYLLKLSTHVHSCMFGTFLCNAPKERAESSVADTTASVWPLLDSPAYRNHLYSPPSSDQVLWPDFNVRSLTFWWEMFVGPRAETDDEVETRPALSQSPPGPMTKTRSCDNLLNEGEKKTMQRRCSDPNISPDVMKLSNILPNGSPVTIQRPESPKTVVNTDNGDGDQVDGLHPHHFENGSASPQCVRDLASNSSSLERELAAERGADEIYGDNETNREQGGRHRNLSITWGSVSESSHHTDSSEQDPRLNSNHNSNVNDMTNHKNDEPCKTNGDDTVVLADGAKLSDVELGATSSSISSESECDAEGGGGAAGGTGVRRRPPRLRPGSQQTLCGGSPRGAPRRVSATSGIETSGSSLGGSSCACACSLTRGASLDGLPPAADVVQARLQQIIMHQRMVVEDLSAQLRTARLSLQQRVTSPPPPPTQEPAQLTDRKNMYHAE